MLSLELKDSSLSLNGDELNDWENNLFFTVTLGFDKDYTSQKLVLAKPADLYLIVESVTAFLQNKKIEYTVNSEVQKLIEDLDEEGKEYRYAVHVARNLPRLKIPKGFIRKLKPYQHKGFEHLVAIKHSANFSVPGSGKTSVVYAAFSYLHEIGVVDKLLVIGPLSSFLPWEDESAACFGTKITSARLSGSKGSRQSIYLQANNFTLFLCSYQAASNDQEEIAEFLLKKHKFLMVIDESHNIKRFHEGTWSEAMLGLSRYATKRVILTGTPAPNSYLDLWSQFTFLWPAKNILGPKEIYQTKTEDKNASLEIRKAIKPFVYRVNKSELKLPKPYFKYYFCDMKPYQSKIYEALATKFLTELKFTTEENMYVRGWRRARIVRLIQTASNPTLLAQFSSEFDIKPIDGLEKSIIELIEKYPEYELPAKFEKLYQIVNDLVEHGKKVIVWSSFIHNILTVKQFLDEKRIQTFIIYGAVPKDEDADIEFNREQQIRDFKHTNGPCVLLANPAACAESISLHRVCHDSIYLDRTFDCGQYLQSLDRIHRIGLTPKEIVTYHLLIAKDSIDETIDRRLKEKEINMLQVLESDLPIGGLQADDNSMAQTEEEEFVDFKETLKDIRSNYSK